MLRFVGFTGAPVLSALAPFIILPVISRVVGSEGWANFSAGQSIGILGMVIVLFGWGIVGPVRVARSTSTAEKAALLYESLLTRAVTVSVAVPAVAIATYLISGPSFRLESVCVAVAMTLGGLSPAWFCIGEGNPQALMLYDALPKLAASLVALPIVALSAQVLWYPAIMVAFMLPSFTVHAWRTAHPRLREGQPVVGIGRCLRVLLPTAGIDGASNLYASTPVPIATAGLSSEDASAFASSDRVYRVALLTVVAIGNAFQAWVLNPLDTDPARRHRLSIVVHLVLGLLGGAAIALLSPWATTILFGEDVAAQPLPGVLFGVSFFFLSTTTPLIRNLLIPAQRYRLVFAATIAAAAGGLATMLAGSALESPVVISLGVSISEAVSFGVLVVPALRELSRIGRSDTSPEVPLST
ncbi:polysaccharide biosynthesis protein [Microbacterium sp.]|uniref:polysaccharide biosynthesis protein n=1 Tax=Microbacterium sp. TaxID=51671 RepID=UPI002811F0E3|nr:polysaccharide biosynthesis protein [Microbacterium sp.]